MTANEPTTGAGPHLVLVGLMGAGKSTVGRRLADELGWRFVDLDDVITERAGRSISDLFAELGEEGFRALEQAAVAEVMAQGSPLVVAAGGGAVLREANRAALRARGTVVWLRAQVATLVARVGAGAGRPLLAGDPAATLQRLEHERAEAYRHAAHVVVDVDGLDADEVVQRIRRAVPMVVR